MEEAGSRPFAHPAMRQVAEEIFHRLVEGLEVSPGALMNALSEEPVQKVIAASAMIGMEESLAAIYIKKNLTLYMQRSLREEIKEISGQIARETDMDRKKTLLTRQNTLKTRLGHLMDRS